MAGPRFWSMDRFGKWSQFGHRIPELLCEMGCLPVRAWANVGPAGATHRNRYLYGSVEPPCSRKSDKSGFGVPPRIWRITNLLYMRLPLATTSRRKVFLFAARRNPDVSAFRHLPQICLAYPTPNVAGECALRAPALRPSESRRPVWAR